jgi:hypothetical protein
MVKVTGFPGFGHKTKNPQALPEGLVEVGGVPQRGYYIKFCLSPQPN